MLLFAGSDFCSNFDGAIEHRWCINSIARHRRRELPRRTFGGGEAVGFLISINLVFNSTL